MISDEHFYAFFDVIPLLRSEHLRLIRFPLIKLGLEVLSWFDPLGLCLRFARKYGLLAKLLEQSDLVRVSGDIRVPSLVHLLLLVSLDVNWPKESLLKLLIIINETVI